jgi:hypothetical protein
VNRHIPPKRRWSVHPAAWLLASLLVLVQGSRAVHAGQEVEQFYGLTRIDAGVQKKPAPTPVPETRIEPAERKEPAPLPMPEIPAIPLPSITEEKQVPAAPLQAEPVRNTIIPPATAEPETVAKPKEENVQSKIAPVAPAPVRSRPVAGETGPPPGVTVNASPAESFWKTFLLGGFIMASAIVAPLALLLGLYTMLVRYSRGTGPLFRIEYVGNPQAVVLGPYPVPTHGLPGAETGGGRLASTISEVSAASTTAEKFDLGPTFEEARMQQEEQAKQRESAILQQVFEQNLRLQENLERAREQTEAISNPEEPESQSPSASEPDSDDGDSSTH